jgi:hypothetical protein
VVTDIHTGRCLVGSAMHACHQPHHGGDVRDDDVQCPNTFVACVAHFASRNFLATFNTQYVQSHIEIQRPDAGHLEIASRFLFILRNLWPISCEIHEVCPSREARSKATCRTRESVGVRHSREARFKVT